MKRVKIACDVNIPQRLVRVLQTGFGDQGFEFIWEPEFAAATADDEVWADAFKRFGGQVVLSGDKNIAKRPHQMIAFQDNDFICFFCDRLWNNQDLTFKVAHLVYWWPRIQEKLADSVPRDCWWVPMGIRPLPFRKVEIPAHVLQQARKARPD